MASPALIMADMEALLLQEIIKNLSKGNIGTAEWQASRLAQRGRISRRMADQVAKATKEAAEGVSTELQRAFNGSIRKFDDSLAGTKYAGALPSGADDTIRGVLATWDSVAVNQYNQVGAKLLQSANTAYVDIINQATAQVLTGDITGRQAITQAARQWADSGLPAFTDSIGRRISTEAYSQTIIRSNVRNVATDTQLSRAQQYGIDLVQIDSHPGARELCEPYQGRIFSISGNSDKYPALDSTSRDEPAGLFGINCVIEGTLVSGPRISTLYRRKYSGEIITIKTASGKELSVTTKHPILTDKGWIDAGLLKKGDNVISNSRSNRKRRISPNPYNNITHIEKLFSSFLKRRDMFRLPSSPGDFHGDSTDSNVDVVFRHCFLWYRAKAALNKHIEKDFLHNTAKTRGSFFAFSSLNKIAVRFYSSFNSLVSFFSNSFAALNSSPLVNRLSCLRSTTSLIDTHFRKVCSDSPLRNPDMVCNLGFPHTGIVKIKQFFRSISSYSKKPILPVFAAPVDSMTREKVYDSLCGTANVSGYRARRFAGIITIDNIVGIERKPSNSSFIHVYNLETKNHWYYSNSIISHNCTHNMYPYIEGQSKLYQPVPEESNAEARQNQQRQREIERSIRQAKREEAVLRAGGNAIDPGAVKAAHDRVLARQSAMRDFIDKTGRTRQRSREQI